MIQTNATKMLVNDDEMSVGSYTHFTIIDEHFTIINEHFAIIYEHFCSISLKYTIILIFLRNLGNEMYTFALYTLFN